MYDHQRHRGRYLNAWTMDAERSAHRTRLNAYRKAAERIWADAVRADQVASGPALTVDRVVFERFSDATEGLPKRDRDGIWKLLAEWLKYRV